MKKLLSVLLVALLVAGLMTSALAGAADGKKIALVGKSAGNAFRDRRRVLQGGR